MSGTAANRDEASVAYPAPRTTDRIIPTVGVVCDMLEEGWPSMDLVGDMLVDELCTAHASRFATVRFRPAMPRRISAPVGSGGKLFAADRLIARFIDYPRLMRRQRDACDVFHIVDHSYSRLVHSLRPGRTVVTCTISIPFARSSSRSGADDRPCLER